MNIKLKKANSRVFDAGFPTLFWLLKKILKKKNIYKNYVKANTDETTINIVKAAKEDLNKLKCFKC